MVISLKRGIRVLVTLAGLLITSQLQNSRQTKTKLVKPSMESSTDDSISASHETYAIHASLLDALAGLGAMESESVVAEWMFNDRVQEVTASDTQQEMDAMPAHPASVQFKDDTKAATKPNKELSPTRHLPSSIFPKLTSPFRAKPHRSQSSSSAIAVNDVIDYETDEGYTSASPPKSSKARSLFTRKKSSAASAPSDSPVKSPAAPSPTAKAKALFRRATNKSQEEPSSLHEGWLEVSALTPEAFSSNGTERTFSHPNLFESEAMSSTLNQDGFNADNGRIAAGANAKPQNLSLIIPHTVFQSPSFGARRRAAPPRPLSLLTINTSFDNSPSHRYSTSLPPSPFILVRPDENGDVGETPATSYEFFSPVNGLDVQLSGNFEATPIYPLSISKTLRRSMLLGDTYAEQQEYIYDSRVTGAHHGSSSSLPESALSPVSALSPDLEQKIFPSIKRGRELPFPVRPVLPIPLSLTMSGSDVRTLRNSMDARVAVLKKRYHELPVYGIGGNRSVRSPRQLQVVNQ